MRLSMHDTSPPATSARPSSRRIDRDTGGFDIDSTPGRKANARCRTFLGDSFSLSRGFPLYFVVRLRVLLKNHFVKCVGDVRVDDVAVKSAVRTRQPHRQIPRVAVVVKVCDPIFASPTTLGMFSKMFPKVAGIGSGDGC